MYLHGSAPTLETPSQKSREYAGELRSKVIMTNIQEETIKTLKKQSGLEEDSKELKPKKKRGKSGPNPLSCKKKKKKENPSIANLKVKKVKEDGKVKKRKRIKLPVHIKEVLKTNA